MGRNKKGKKQNVESSPEVSSDDEPQQDVAPDTASESSSEEERRVQVKKPKHVPKKAQQQQNAAKKGSKGGAAAADDDDDEEEGAAASKPDAAAASETGPVKVTKMGTLDVTYCPTCTLPPEFCQFSGKFEACKEWLGQMAEDDPWYNRILDGEECGRKQKAGGGTGKKAMVKEVTIETNKRMKRKFTTIVQGLDAFGVDLKAVCAEWKKKFSCGVSVEERPGQPDAVEVQGDVFDTLATMLPEAYGIPVSAMFRLEKGKKSKV
jgi:translation initiation factor 1 (eIF-1/SUI1)